VKVASKGGEGEGNVPIIVFICRLVFRNKKTKRIVDCCHFWGGNAHHDERLGFKVSRV
jgi:hypothetical protein